MIMLLAPTNTLRFRAGCAANVGLKHLFRAVAYFYCVTSADNAAAFA